MIHGDDPRGQGVVGNGPGEMRRRSHCGESGTEGVARRGLDNFEFFTGGDREGLRNNTTGHGEYPSGEVDRRFAANVEGMNGNETDRAGMLLRLHPHSGDWNPGG